MSKIEREGQCHHLVLSGIRGAPKYTDMQIWEDGINWDEEKNVRIVDKFHNGYRNNQATAKDALKQIVDVFEEAKKKRVKGEFNEVNIYYVRGGGNWNYKDMTISYMILPLLKYDDVLMH